MSAEDLRAPLLERRGSDGSVVIRTRASSAGGAAAHAGHELLPPRLREEHVWILGSVLSVQHHIRPAGDALDLHSDPERSGITRRASSAETLHLENNP